MKRLEVQSILLSKRVFVSRKAATDWARAHEVSSRPEETGNVWRFRVSPPGVFVKSSFRTIGWSDGVQAIMGHRRAARRNGEVTPRELERARAEYRRAHWGEAGEDDEPRDLQMAAPGDETFIVMGRLTHVTYETSKGREGEQLWEHAFDNPPLLVYGRRSKRLGIAGGSYTVTSRGIEG